MNGKGNYNTKSETNCENVRYELKDGMYKNDSLNISEVTEKSIDQAQKWFENLQMFCLKEKIK